MPKRSEIVAATSSATDPSFSSMRSAKAAKRQSTVSRTVSTCTSVRSSINACSASESALISRATPMMRASTSRSIAARTCSWSRPCMPTRSASISSCSATGASSVVTRSATVWLIVPSCTANASACSSTRWESVPSASAPVCT